jgi:fumarate reductase flavoprotein subunit
MSARFDVVVIGGGLAGLACANRCAEEGLSVAVLERGAEELYPCNSRFAMGFINCAFEHARGDPQVLRGAIDRLTRGYADPALAEAFSSNIGHALRWLRAQGVRVIKGGWQQGQRELLAPPPLMRPGLHWAGRGADSMVRQLIRQLESRGGTLLRGTRARELLMQSGRCVGVGAEQGGQPVRFDAFAVLIADGGFQADHELLARYVTRKPEALLQRNAQSGRGDGLRMATAIGAHVRGTDRFYGHVQSRDAMKNPLLWPYPTMDSPIHHGIVVDGRARRFCDEGLGGVYVANEIARLDDPLESVAIFDDAIWNDEPSRVARPPNPLVEKVGGTIYSAATLDELAVKAGLPAQSLAATVDTFNRAVDQNALDQLEPARTAKVYKPMKIAKAPFYAVPVCAGITYTMGGIAIDGQCRVVNAQGQVIEGLYAAGSTTGGHEGGPVAGYTGGLGKAMTFGWHAGNRIAAAHAANEIK